MPDLTSKEGAPETFRGVFIRAPAILEVAPQVQVLVDYPVLLSKEVEFKLGIEAPEVGNVVLFPSTFFSLFNYI